MSRAKLPTFCETCSAETAGAEACAECSADPGRAEFVRLCAAVLTGDGGDRDGQVARARELREAGRWSAFTVKLLLGAANRRAAEPLRQRDLALAGHQHRGRPKKAGWAAR